MLRSSRSRWISGIGAAVLSGGLLVAGYGTGVPPAEATITLVNPFPIIIDKLNQILAKLSTSGEGGGNHTLRWDTNNPSATRFTVLAAIPGAALDNNTGLVWEQAPSGTRFTWSVATSQCLDKVVGGTRGWRLPSAAELTSVTDPSLPGMSVPGTVFTGVLPEVAYWSATTNVEDPLLAWMVATSGGSLVGNGKRFPGNFWCVRGGMNADAH